jgi:uncharacterized protein YndB with AHSA1/START domain
MDSSDRIEKQVTLLAPVSRVWQAITDANEFGRWFGINLEGEFVLGKPIVGSFKAAISEDWILEHQKKLGLEPSRIRLPAPGFVFCTPERIEPEDYFSFRWIPYGIDAEVDLASEPTTLVEFRFEALPEGTLLTITESGFDRVPVNRRERAFRMNESGWSGQADNIRKYIEIE